MVVLQEPLFHLPIGATDPWGKTKVSRLISVIHIAKRFCRQNVTYSAVIDLKLFSMELLGNKSDSAIITRAFATIFLQMPKWKICHKSRQKKPLTSSLLTGRPDMMSGSVSHGKNCVHRCLPTWAGSEVLIWKMFSAILFLPPQAQMTNSFTRVLC